jgi:hypothetical protein
MMEICWYKVDEGGMEGVLSFSLFLSFLPPSRASLISWALDSVGNGDMAANEASSPLCYPTFPTHQHIHIHLDWKQLFHRFLTSFCCLNRSAIPSAADLAFHPSIQLPRPAPHWPNLACSWTSFFRTCLTDWKAIASSASLFVSSARAISYILYLYILPLPCLLFLSPSS